MQKWEYMWMYMASEKGRQVFIANGERVQKQTYAEALNALQRWLGTSVCHLSEPNPSRAQPKLSPVLPQEASSGVTFIPICCSQVLDYAAHLQ